MTQQKVYLKTFGCQMNEYDSDKLANLLLHKNYALTSDITEADVILLNTCSIRHKAEEKVFSDLGRLRRLKKQKPDLVIGVGGCVATQEGQEILKRSKDVNLIFGPQTIHRVPEMIERSLQTHQVQLDISWPEVEKFDNLILPKLPDISAFVSIMEGCSKYCSYCVVPYTRGEEISRSPESIVQEVEILTQRGVREINLLGQNVNAYLGLGKNGLMLDFAGLLHRLHGLDNIKRIRYTTSHPTHMSKKLIACYGQLPKLVSHLHLPVQSGSNKVLRLMKRGYTAENYLQIIDSLRQERPDMSFSSDFIVGFPGETDEDFACTMDLIDKVQYDISYSFIYSKRPGTPASFLEDSVPDSVKAERLKVLQAKLKLQADTISRNMLGKVQKVLIEGKASRNKSQLSGRTENSKVVNFCAAEELIGQIKEFKITEQLAYTLRGELIN